MTEGYANAEVQDIEEFKQAQSDQINQFVAVIYVLLMLAVVIALFGIGNTLALSIIERTRELGLLRAVGMTRRQLRTTVRWEAILTSLLRHAARPRHRPLLRLGHRGGPQGRGPEGVRHPVRPARDHRA